MLQHMKSVFAKFVVLSVVALLALTTQAHAAVTDLYDAADVSSQFDSWSASQGTILASAVTVAFAIIAVFTAIRYISRLATKARA